MINKIKKILFNTFPDLILRDGKPITDLLIKPAAAINESYEAEKINLMEKLFLGNYDKTTFEEYDLVVSNYLNTSRRLGVFSSTTVRIFLTQRADIVFDKQRSSFQDFRGHKFLPRFDFAVSSDNLKFDTTTSKYYIDIPVISEDPFGEEYLINPGDISVYLGNNEFVERVTNLNSSVLVDIQESNTELYNRITENGIVLNSSRNNYLGNLLYQTFADIKKFMPVGSNNSLMLRDLTFNSIDANIAITEYNFYKKKTLSTIDNANRFYSGLLSDITPDNIEPPVFSISADNFKEIKQSDYDAIAFRDKNSASISSLVYNDIFALYSGISDLSSADWFVSENGATWNKGSSNIEFTNKFDTGIRVKGKSISEPLLANLDSGLVLYKEVGDPKNTEYLLEFMIEDFESNLVLKSDAGLTKKIISNNNPLYFTVLKNGIKDSLKNLVCSTYDGYGVVIKRSVNSKQPNVFIIDGSSGMGEVAFEQEILALGSERVLAGAAIPLNAGTKYTCIIQVNEGYGMKVIFKNEFNAELGTMIVGSGSVDSDFTTTYTTESSFEEKEFSDFVPSPTNVPRKFTFITSTNEDDYCSSFLDLAFTVIQSENDLSKAIKTSDKILTLKNSAINDFTDVIVGDSVELLGETYLVTNVFTNLQIELDRSIPDLNVLGESWKIWRSITANIDYSLPNKPFITSLIVSNLGVEKISNIINLANCDLKFLYIKKTGITNTITLDWNSSNGSNMKAYSAQTDPEPIKLNNTIIFDSPFSSNYYFKDCLINYNYNAIYLTQIGYDKLISSYLRVQINSEDPYLIKKENFKQGYYLPVPYISTVDKITYIDTLKLKSSGYTFTKDTHYEVLNDVVTDILVNPIYFQLFNGELEISAEIIGPSTNAEVSGIGSNKGTNKLYLETSTVLNGTDYFSVIINNERYFVQSIDLNSINSPYADKKIEIILDRIIPAFENNLVKLRKSSSITTDSNYLRFGYRYDIYNNKTSANYWKPTDTFNITTGSKLLVKGEDFDNDKNIKISNYYITEEIFNSFTSDDQKYISFLFDYRTILEERKSDGFTNFKPVSTGSYLGVGFKSVNNGSWRILNLKVRKLLEKHSVFAGEFYVGNRPVTNEDRFKINLTTYALNTNAVTTPLNGSRVFIFNNNLNRWEVLYENNVNTSEGNASVILQYYDGPDKDDRPFEFGYWDGSTFITVNNNLYPADYVNKGGNLYLLIASRGKNEKNFNSNIVFGEARLFLDYINIIWQRKNGIHLGNKLDIWTASASNYKTNNLQYTLNSSSNKIIIDELFYKPIIRINKITPLGSNIPISFEIINNNSNTRFTTKEDLEILFSNTLAAGVYNINYDYYPHLTEKQQFIDSLETHIDCLVRQFVPCFIKLNLGYYGTIDVNSTKEEIFNYVRFSNILDINYIRAIIQDNGAVLTSSVNSLPFAEIEEYDLIATPIKKSIYSYYSLKSEKFFDLKKEDINLIKLT